MTMLTHQTQANQQHSTAPKPIQTQLTLFSWREVDRSPEIERLKAILDTLPDEELIAALIRKRAGKRNDYPITMLWRCFIAGQLLGLNTAALIRELKRNAELREICGFHEIRSARNSVPPDYVFSKFYKKIQCHEDLLLKIYKGLLERISVLLPDFGKDLAMDTKAIISAAKAKDATIGTKTYDDDKNGKRTMTWEGYKLHLTVDANYELPVCFALTQAHVGDSPRLKPMMQELKQEHPDLHQRVETLAADKAYDDTANKRALYDEDGIVPLIPPRDMLTQTGDPIRALDPKQSDTIYVGPTGQLFCKTHPFESNPEKKFTTMAFSGFEKARSCLKFRCPAAVYGASCENRDACRCKPTVRDGAYGRVVRVALDKDRRIFLPAHYHSHTFKQGYKKRTSVERVNYRIDHVHGFERTFLRSLKTVRVFMTATMIVMLASACSWIEAGKAYNMRRILKPAA
jgi:hypothetical protein